MLIVTLLLVVTPEIVQGTNPPSNDRPNFILFMVDDLGYGDIASFGNKTLSTPRIDALATEGVRLTHSLALSSLCTPSRAAFLTGRYPVRYGMEGDHMPVIPFLATSGGLPNTEVTFAKALQQTGYSTALIGKWHQGLHCSYLGDNCHHPNTHGFQYFYGTPFSNHPHFGNSQMPMFVSRVYPKASLISAAVVGIITSIFLWLRGHHRLAGLCLTLVIVLASSVLVSIFAYKRLNSILLRNDIVIEQPINFETLTKRFVDESITFIEEQSKKDNPFLLFLSFTHVHDHIEVQKRFRNSGPHGRYGDSIRETDWAVGQVVDTVKRLDLKNTMFFFSSDHGAHEALRGPTGEVTGGSNHPFSGGKSMFGIEGGIRVPVIFSWPGKFLSNVVLDTPTTLMDLFPTILNLGGVDVTQYQFLDGYDLSPLLTGNRTSSRYKFIFHYGPYNSIHAVRYIEDEKAVWKVHFKTPRWIQGTRSCPSFCGYRDTDTDLHVPPLIYNIITDPGENKPLSTTLVKHKEIVDIVLKAIENHKQELTSKPSPQLDGYNTVWKFWLQPCCNFPYCKCREDDTAHS